jgi:outer membrane protein assembly factor BamB
MIARFLCLLLALGVLAPGAALAQNWNITTIDGHAVMGESSTLTFEVSNESNNRLTEVTLGFVSTSYALEGASAPAGWTVAVDLANRRVTFSQPTASCPNVGLAQAGTARFSVRVVGASDKADVSDAFASFSARDGCANRLFKNKQSPRWTRHGLALRTILEPRAFGVGDLFDARITVENRTSSPQAGVTAEGPSITGDANFQFVSLSPQPFSIDLAAGQSGTLVARLRAMREGTAIGQVFARNGGSTTTSPTLDTRQLNVRPLAAYADVEPLQVLSGDTVTVRLTLVNTTAANMYTTLRPRAPVPQGTASATLVSGPVPAQVAALGPGQSTRFSWTYRIAGPVGASYAFQAQADALLNGAAVATDAVVSEPGALAAHKLVINPDAVLSGTSRTVSYTLINQGDVEVRQVRLVLPAQAATLAASPATLVPAGWSFTNSATAGPTWAAQSGQPGIPKGGSLTFALTFSSVASVTADTPYTHRAQLSLGTGTSAPVVTVSAGLTVMVNRVLPDVESLVALAGEGRTSLIWNNPSDHGGVLVLRAAGAEPDTRPIPGQRYRAGETLGNATVVYADALSAVSRIEDTSVTNGTGYVYRVFNHDDLHRYGVGNVPTSFGLKASPRTRGAGAPLWCYTVGMSTLQQPITEAGAGIFTAFNDTVIANRTTPTTPATDGDERWRPVRLQGTIGGRFPVVPLRGLSGQSLLVGTQEGAMYALSAQTGAVLWRGDNGQLLGRIQSFPVTQLHDFANTAYKAAHPNRDLVFFATRIDGNPTGNKVIALNGATGARVWLYQPGDLDMVSGGMLVDYTSNRLYVPARSNGGTQASLRVLDTLTGQEVARLSLGDVEHSLVRIPATNQVLVTGSSGTVSGVGMTSLKVEWSTQLPGLPTSFVRPHGRGFVASLQSGRVELYVLQTASGVTTATRSWSTAVPNPTGAFLYVKDGRSYVYVGGSDGKVHELDVTTGVDQKQVSLGTAQLIGTPTVDSTSARLHVGTQDGRVCAYPVPFL